MTEKEVNSLKLIYYLFTFLLIFINIKIYKLSGFILGFSCCFVL
jgi:hypothetical protein